MRGDEVRFVESSLRERPNSKHRLRKTNNVCETERETDRERQTERERDNVEKGGHRETDMV